MLVTSSARKAAKMLCVGRRVEVWNNNERAATYTFRNKEAMRPFECAEKEYIKAKQEKATRKNSRKGEVK